MSVDRLLGTCFLKKVFDSPDFLTISKIVRVLYGRRYVEYIKSYEFERQNSKSRLLYASGFYCYFMYFLSKVYIQLQKNR